MLSMALFSCVQVPKDIYPNVKLTQCDIPKPQICTREYRPVCGFENDGNHKSFSNACTACSDQKVTSYSEVDCSELQGPSK